MLTTINRKQQEISCFVTYRSTQHFTHGIKRTAFKNGREVVQLHKKSKCDTALFIKKKSKIERTELPMGGMKHTAHCRPLLYVLNCIQVAETLLELGIVILLYSNFPH